MVRTRIVKFLRTDANGFVKLVKSYGESTDTKPTELIAEGSEFVEVDTGDKFAYIEESESWVKQPKEGGGGGGGAVDDVQINGTSIVSGGVANIPKSANNVLGVTKPNGMGVGVNTSGDLYITPADSSVIKAGTQQYTPITATNQHHAIFYGLAKAAGDTSQSASNNPTGTYTDTAKVAIQKMLGIYEAPWELIREDTFTNATEADHTVSVDGNGQPFALTDVILMFETPVQTTEAKKANYGQLRFYTSLDGTDFKAVECNAWTQAANASATGCFAILENRNGMIFLNGVKSATSTNSGNVVQRYGAGFTGTAQNIFIPNGEFTIKKVVIPGVTGTGHYKLYGKRKWN